jgi:hypothetical protein
MVKKSFILIFLLLFLSGYDSPHPLKMTFSKLTVTSKGGVELETRIFLDDLSEHLQKLYGLPEVDFSSTTSNGTEALQNYLYDRFYFEQDGKKVYLAISNVFFSTNGLALVVNLNTVVELDKTTEIFLVNTLLCDAFPIQVNDIRYQNEHHKLTIGNPKLKIQID